MHSDAAYLCLVQLGFLKLRVKIPFLPTLILTRT